MTDRDIVDDINALVDAQLEQERSGYDHNLSNERCLHCGRDWHGLAITERMEQMRQRFRSRAQMAALYGEGETGYAESVIDPDYRYADDDSRVLCPGSTAPAPAEPVQRRPHPYGFGGVAPGPVTSALMEHLARLAPLYSIPDGVLDDVLSWTDPSRTTQARWWRLDHPSEAIDYELRRNVQHDENLGDMVTRCDVTLVMRSRTGNIEEVPLLADSEGNTHRISWAEGPRSEGTRPERFEIYAATAPTFGGTWEPISAPGYTGRPYFNGPPIREGDRVAYEDATTGEFVVGTVTHADGPGTEGWGASRANEQADRQGSAVTSIEIDEPFAHRQRMAALTALPVMPSDQLRRIIGSAT